MVDIWDIILKICRIKETIIVCRCNERSNSFFSGSHGQFVPWEWLCNKHCFCFIIWTNTEKLHYLLKNFRRVREVPKGDCWLCHFCL